MYQKPLSKNGKQRIDIMRATNDGFVLAEKDLEIRGPGQVLGTRQSGASLFKMADLERDSDLIPDVVAYSDKVIDQNPTVAKKLIRRWCPLASNYIDVWGYRQCASSQFLPLPTSTTKGIDNVAADDISWEMFSVA